MVSRAQLVQEYFERNSKRHVGKQILQPNWTNIFFPSRIDSWDIIRDTSAMGITTESIIPSKEGNRRVQSQWDQMSANGACMHVVVM